MSPLVRHLVTGACGFIGAAIVTRALRDGDTVAVLVRPGRDPGRLTAVQQQLTWIEADFAALDEPSVRHACAAFAPDTVIHAGWAGVAGRARNETWQVQRNLPAAVELTRLASASGAKHFIGLGSQAEYGECEGRISEGQPLRPTTLYGAAKAAAALLTRTVSEQVGMQHSWLRVFSTYGAGADPSWVLSMAATAFASGIAPALTPCEQRWEFLHTTDAARGVLAAARHTAAGTYNLGSGDARILRDVLLALRDRIDPTIEPRFAAVAYRPDQVMWLEADITRMQHATGWSPCLTLEAGLDELACEALNNREIPPNA